MEYISMRDVRITDPLFARYQRIVTERMIPYQWEVLNDRAPGVEPSGCMHNLRVAAGEETGEFVGMVFQDSDLMKWLEAAAYSLIVHPDENLERLIDEGIRLIGKAQQPDGYFNTYFTIKEPERRWTNLLEAHELYCAGHMIEAAVAHHQATGKDDFINIARKMADHIGRHFGPAPDQSKGCAGHPEIELALYRLAKETGEERYAELAQHFLDVRGNDEPWVKPGQWYVWDWMPHVDTSYNQAHLPVREQRTAIGHSVRAMYLYSAMADAARLTGEPAMADACHALFDNVVTRQMYITGGIGQAASGEKFTVDYDLPNDMVYAETCASIGLMMFAQRMFPLDKRADNMEVWERALRNTVLAGMDQQGERFFYVNPLAVDPRIAKANPGFNHVKTVRQQWFGCACCPPNIARAILSMGGSLYAKDGKDVYLLAHIPSDADWDAGQASLTRQDNDYTLTITGDPCRFYLRIPQNARTSLADSGNGFAVIEHSGGKGEYQYTIQDTPTLFAANPAVGADVGKAAIVEGETVYCLESIDNGAGLSAIYLDPAAQFEPVVMDWLPEGMHALKTSGFRLSQSDWDGALYAPWRELFEPCTITAVPYSQWNNRGEGEMAVWLNVTG
ncbi:hypothetical protein AGMMS49992_02820 [Clostridia bacterium]|nr:hypothetical protein AGMMS49992_02820 [Clostridia bacterium]